MGARIAIERLQGLKFSRLTIIGEASQTKFLVRCDCGKEFNAAKGHVKNGNTKSCGCYKLEAARVNATKHGMYGHPLYGTWADMRKRCLNSKCRAYKDYGGRGITICAEWDDFATFVKDMGDKPYPSATLDRRDTNLGYDKNNCKWSSVVEQSVNKRLSLRYTYQDVDYTMRELSNVSKQFGISYGTLRDRISKGIPVSAAVETPLIKPGWHPAIDDGRDRVSRPGVKKLYL